MTQAFDPECDRCGGCGWEWENGIEERWKVPCSKCNQTGEVPATSPPNVPHCGNCAGGVPRDPDNCSKCGRDGERYSHWTPAPLSDEAIELAWRSCGTEPDGSNLAGGTNLEGWTRAIRWAEQQHGIHGA